MDMLPGVVCMPNAQLQCLQNAIPCREHSFTDEGQDTEGEELWLSREVVHHVIGFSSLDTISVHFWMSMQEETREAEGTFAQIHGRWVSQV